VRVGVLIHGYHLQAKNWKEVVWGNPPFCPGRVPQGIKIALEEKAKLIVFGTGASERNGKKEAEYTRDYLLEHFFELSNFEAFKKFDLKKAKDKIQKRIRVEILSQNTFQEIKFAGQIFKKEKIEKIILVSSPSHLSRCLRDACHLYLNDFLISASPAKTDFASPGKVIIIEPSHQKDQAKTNLYSFYQKLFQLPKEKQLELLEKLEPTLDQYLKKARV